MYFHPDADLLWSHLVYPGQRLSDRAGLLKRGCKYALLCDPDLFLFLCVSGDLAAWSSYICNRVDGFFPGYCRPAASWFCTRCGLCSCFWFWFGQCGASGIFGWIYRTDLSDWRTDCAEESGARDLRICAGVL